jgi:hypothetical protein
MMNYSNCLASEPSENTVQCHNSGSCWSSAESGEPHHHHRAPHSHQQALKKPRADEPTKKEMKEVQSTTVGCWDGADLELGLKGSGVLAFPLLWAQMVPNKTEYDFIRICSF